MTFTAGNTASPRGLEARLFAQRLERVALETGEDGRENAESMMRELVARAKGGICPHSGKYRPPARWAMRMAVEMLDGKPHQAQEVKHTGHVELQQIILTRIEGRPIPPVPGLEVVSNQPAIEAAPAKALPPKRDVL